MRLQNRTTIVVRADHRDRSQKDFGRANLLRFSTQGEFGNDA
jgi:hypothetical protein